MKRTITLSSILLLSLGAFSPAFASSGQLSGEEVNEVVTDNYSDIVECYMDHAAKQKSASGQVKIRWVVRSAGDVDGVQVEAPGVKGDEFSSCVVSEVQTWRFSEIAGATEVEYPFTFQRTRVAGAGPTSR